MGPKDSYGSEGEFIRRGRPVANGPEQDIRDIRADVKEIATKGWAAAYQRDTAASKKEYEDRIRILTADLNADETVWEDAKGKMGAPWSPPKGAKALQERFKKLGYRGNLR